MLVFAGSGLDAVVKQLIRDALPLTVEQNAQAASALEKFVSRKLLSTDSDEAASRRIDNKLLSSLLVADSARKKAIVLLVEELAGSSLQSFEQLKQIEFYLGQSMDLDGPKARLDEAFQERNKIVHEMDINFDHPTRNRYGRRKPEIIEQCNTLLQTAGRFLKKVDAGIRTPP